MLKEIISVFTQNNTTTRNLKSAISKLPVAQKVFANKNFDKISKKLDLLETQKELKLKKEFIKKKAFAFGVSQKELLTLEDKALAILKEFDTGYSMGDYKELHINGSMFLSCSTCRDYAKTCRFKPTHGSVIINLSLKELRSLVNIGGIWTIVGKRTSESKKVFRCKVLTELGSKGSYRVVMESMYLTSDYHAPSIEECLLWRDQMVSRMRSRRTHANQERELLTKVKTMFVSFEDSLKVGNCEIGSEKFCNRHGLDKTHGYRLDYLLSLEPNNSYLKRLLTFAKQ